MSQPINFQELPKTAPNALPAAGVYRYRIVAAQMRQGANYPYLEVKAEIYHPVSGEKVYTLYDRLFDTPQNLPRYKLGRFIKALELPITGEFYLADLTKMIVGKEIYADLGVEKDKNGVYPDRLAVNAFSDLIYYTKKEYAQAIGANDGSEGEDEDMSGDAAAEGGHTDAGSDDEYDAF